MSITREQLEAAIGKEPSGFVDTDRGDVIEIYEVTDKRVFYKYSCKSKREDFATSIPLENAYSWELTEPKKPKRDLMVIDMDNVEKKYSRNSSEVYYSFPIQSLTPLTPEIIKEYLEEGE